MKSQLPQWSRVGHLLRGSQLYAVAFIAAALLLLPAGASAASPVLEFVVPGHSLPVTFTTESGAVNAEMAGFESLVHCTASQGEGEITGPRSTVSKYRFTGCVTEMGSHAKCKSAGANEEEITTGPIDAELVYIDQARREVGMLLNPGGGTYIAFECGGESAEGQGPFLAPVSPINQEATSFTATLNQLDSVQTPDEYENEKGERLQAIPTGRRGANKFVPTGVEAAFTVYPSAPVEIKAITAGEIEATQREEEAAAKKHAEEEAAAKKKAEEAAAKKKSEEAAAKKKAEEEAAAKKKAEEEASASVKIEKFKVTASSIVVTIKTSEPGTVRITGPGLKKTVKTLAAGTHKVTVPLTKAGKTARKRHKKIALSVRLKTNIKTVSASKRIKL